jgi:hypothetical protein
MSFRHNQKRNFRLAIRWYVREATREQASPPGTLDFVRSTGGRQEWTTVKETANMSRTARCLCGDFRVTVSAEPMLVNVCHCEDCQRRSGAPWSSAAYFPKDAVRLDGPNKIYTRTSDAGTRISHHFCPTCGTTVCWTRETGSTRFGIPVGLFTDPSFPAPTLSVWEKGRYSWAPAVDTAAHWDTQPPAR